VTTNAVESKASPHDVYLVLIDARAYPRWVLGAKRVRAVDPTWPAVGARFHHTIGAPTVDIDDSTKIVELVADRRVVLEARFRPLGTAVVTIDLDPLEGGRTRITMSEAPRSGPIRKWWSIPLATSTGLRNAVSLRRLARLSEHRSRTRRASEGGRRDGE
jgi:uncharacterized protein YndB with AHSA1/START domain